MITVTAGIIERRTQILLAKRKFHKHLGGFWELPGGKLEDNETPEECLERELDEEFSIRTQVLDFVGQSIFYYPEKTIKLLGYRVLFLSGELQLKEHDEVAWVDFEQILQYNLAPADIPIIQTYLKIKEG